MVRGRKCADRKDLRAFRRYVVIWSAEAVADINEIGRSVGGTVGAGVTPGVTERPDLGGSDDRHNTVYQCSKLASRF